jgi:hypothetical protein
MIQIDVDVSDVLAKAEALERDIDRACALSVIDAHRAGELVARQVAPRVSGALAESIEGRYLTFAGGTAEAVVEATAPHAEVVSKGSKPHEITALGKALRFTVGGSVLLRKRVQHPGTKANPYMETVERAAQSNLNSSTEHHVEAACDKFNG